jgi:hypothetical protein
LGGKQQGCPHYESPTAKKQSKREKFLYKKVAVVPRHALIERMELDYDKASKERGDFSARIYDGKVEPELLVRSGKANSNRRANRTLMKRRLHRIHS